MKSKHMPKVIFFIRPMHGHINPTLGLVEELVQRGEEVVYYTTEAFREKVRSTGAVCRFYVDSASRLNRGAEADADPTENKNRDIDFHQKIENVFADLSTRMEDVKTQEQYLYQEIKAQHPDYIIYDYIDAFWGKMLAQKLGIPSIASIPSFAICHQLIQKDPQGLIKFLLHMSPHESPFSEHAIDLKDLIDFISNRIGSTYQIRNFNMLNYGNSELLNIVYNSRFFQPYGEVFDETFKFIGCSFDGRTETEAFPYEKLDKKPIIFISLGTNFNRRFNFYKKCLQAFKDSDKQVVLSAGNRIDFAELGDIPNNFIVREFVPQLEILKRSGLFITHGGLNSVKEGIYFNVPLIVFPQHGDQFAVAHQVNRLGAGICFENSNITGSELREAAQKLYANETFRQNIRKIKESFEKAGGVKRAADEIFKLKEKINKGVKL